jgi:hypothetical protein
MNSIRKGVIRKDCGEREGLLRPDNIDRRKLEEYARVSKCFVAISEHFVKIRRLSRLSKVNPELTWDFLSFYSTSFRKPTLISS